MVILILLIILVSYVLGCVNLPPLVCSLLFPKDRKTAAGCVSYPQVMKAYGWAGVGAVLAADLIRALIVILVGKLLLKGAGFPGVGMRTALLFALLGQVLPVTNGMRGRQGLIFPALLLLWTDWRLLLIAAAVFVIVYLLTKRISLCALAVALSYPVFSLLLGAWWLQVVLALLAAIVMVLPYRVSLAKYFGGLKKAKKTEEEEDI